MGVVKAEGQSRPSSTVRALDVDLLSREGLHHVRLLEVPPARRSSEIAAGERRSSRDACGSRRGAEALRRQPTVAARWEGPWPKQNTGVVQDDAIKRQPVAQQQRPPRVADADAKVRQMGDPGVAGIQADEREELGIAVLIARDREGDAGLVRTQPTDVARSSFRCPTSARLVDAVASIRASASTHSRS